MNGLVYTLHLLEPVLANSLAGDTNSARSLPYIPGGLVRGALIGAYLKQKEIKNVDAADDEFQRLFIDGHTCYLNAYPLLNEQRSLPIPLSWKAPKHAAGGLKNQAVPVTNLAAAETDQTDLKPIRAETWWLKGGTVFSREFPMQINVHNQRDADFGRALEGRGAVYRYEALPAGLELKGIILSENEADIEILGGLLQEGELFLGKARTAGYGRVEVLSAVPLPQDFREGWEISPLRDLVDELEAFERDDVAAYREEAPVEQTDHFYLTFLSPAILRGPGGQYSLDPVPSLESLLGVDLKPEKIFRQVEIVGGFNRTWGLPLPQAHAIAAGSVFWFRCASSVKFKQLMELETRGVGERRSEGFGRVRIDLEQPASIGWRKLDEELEIPGLSTEVSKDAGQAMARIMLERLQRRELERRVLRAVHNYRLRGRVSNSQLARWRVLVRSVLGESKPLEEKLERLTVFYQGEQKRRSSAWQAMERARVENGGNVSRLTEWLSAVLTQKESPWNFLPGEDGDPSSPRISLGPVSITADQELALEYKLRLIDAALAAFAKQGDDQGTSGGGQ